MRNRLRVLRAEHRLSQADLAERVGVSRQTIHALENDKYAPTLTLAYKIASLFGVELERVFQPDPADLLPSLLEPTNGAPSSAPLPHHDRGGNHPLASLRGERG